MHTQLHAGSGGGGSSLSLHLRNCKRLCVAPVRPRACCRCWKMAHRTDINVMCHVTHDAHAMMMMMMIHTGAATAWHKSGCSLPSQRHCTRARHTAQGTRSARTARVRDTEQISKSANSAPTLSQHPLWSTHTLDSHGSSAHAFGPKCLLFIDASKGSETPSGVQAAFLTLTRKLPRRAHADRVQHNNPHW